MSLEDAQDVLLDIDHELYDEEEDYPYYASVGFGEDEELILTLDYADDDGNFGGNVETYVITVTRG